MPKKKRSVAKLQSKPYRRPMTELDDGGGGGGNGAKVEDFIQSGRTGRRNALADILDARCGSTSTAGLPITLAKLSCSDGDNDKAESEKSDQACAAGDDSQTSGTSPSSSPSSTDSNTTSKDKDATTTTEKSTET